MIRPLSFIGSLRDGVRRLRYRRAELLRIPAAEQTGADSADHEAFKWETAGTAGNWLTPTVRCTPGARLRYVVTLPERAIVTVRCSLDEAVAAAPAVGVEFELELRTANAQRSATCRLDAHRGTLRRRSRRLRIRSPEAGPAHILLRTRTVDGTSALLPTATWAGASIEWPRPPARLILTLQSRIVQWSRRVRSRPARLVDGDRLYRDWAREHLTTRRVLRAQRQESQHLLASISDSPPFSLVTSIAGPPFDDLDRTADSVLRQTCPGWEWIVVVAGTTAALDQILGRARRDLRVKVVAAPTASTRADAWNAGLSQARGAFVALLDAHDLLAPEALYEMVTALQRTPDCDLLYSDEDQVDRGDRSRCRPSFKPDWSPDLLLSSNYIGRLALIRASVAAALGGFRGALDSPDGQSLAGAEEWDLLLRLSRSTTRIRRVPRCLYHRAASAPLAAPAAGGAAVADHWRSQGLQVAVSTVEGMSRSIWAVEGTPLVSIVIPNRNAAAVLAPCLRGLVEHTAYQHHEIIIVDNGSTDADVLDMYRALVRDGHGRVVSFDRPFNFSAACNAGAAAARGELLLFLNNDIEVIEPAWLDELIRWAQRPAVGMVGAKLLYPDYTIQHAGVAFGPGGLVDHIFSKAPEGTTGVFGSAESYRNYLAVTGACQMMRAAVFHAVGGYDERFRVSFSDVVLGMETWKAGYRVVYTPYARLLHHESYSRKREDSTHDLALLARYLRDNGFTEDRYFHPELSARSLVPMLRPWFDPAPGQLIRDYVERVLAVAADSAAGGASAG